MRNKKLMTILAAAVLVVCVLCAVVFLADKDDNRQPTENVTVETTAPAEETVDKEESIHIEDSNNDEGFGELIPLN